MSLVNRNFYFKQEFLRERMMLAQLYKRPKLGTGHIPPLMTMISVLMMVEDSSRESSHSFHIWDDDSISLVLFFIQVLFSHFFSCICMERSIVIQHAFQEKEFFLFKYLKK